MYKFLLLLGLAVQALPCLAEQQTEDLEGQRAYLLWAAEFWDSLNPRRGEIELADGVATLQVPDRFYYLDAADAERVLVEAWGNPPGQPVLGMLFPTGTTPFHDNAWAATIEYMQEGYVSDEDADQLDYDDLLSEMQDATREESRQRVEAGYEPIRLVGWASPPFYDAQAHKLHWAKELSFGEDGLRSLNYNIRVLGRQGVLVLNFIADMSQLQEIQQNLDTVLAITDFNEGQRYQDFDPSMDQVAAYGIGALVAGKLAAKMGFLASFLLFAKKFWIFIALGFGALIAKLYRGRIRKTA